MKKRVRQNKLTKFRIEFSNADIDLSQRKKIVIEMMAAASSFRPDNHGVRCEKELLVYFKSKKNFFENHQFEDRYRIGKDTRDINTFDKLRIYKQYENYNQLPFTRAIDHMNKVLAAHYYVRSNAFSNEKLCILEVGGGYGRTALFFLNYFGKKVCYVNIDAVPSAILISQQFLKHNCRKDIRIGGFSDVSRAKKEKKLLILIILIISHCLPGMLIFFRINSLTS